LKAFVPLLSPTIPPFLARFTARGVSSSSLPPSSSTYLPSRSFLLRFSHLLRFTISFSFFHLAQLHRSSISFWFAALLVFPSSRTRQNLDSSSQVRTALSSNVVMDFAPVVWMDIYNAWLALFEIFDLQWGLAFALGKSSRRRNNEFLNIRLVRTYKRADCWRSIYCENYVSIFVSTSWYDRRADCSSSYHHYMRIPSTKANSYFHE